MKQKKESFFWTSYSDLMTSLFFVMLVLFVLAILLMYRRMYSTQKLLQATEKQLSEIKKVEKSTKDLSKKYFSYRKKYKKYVLTIPVHYPSGECRISRIYGSDNTYPALVDAGMSVKSFLEHHENNKYLLIIEGQASRDNYKANYELSYNRALGLLKFWLANGIVFGNNCELLIAGSGDGMLERYLHTQSMREEKETENQRFLIHIIPKNIINENK